MAEELNTFAWGERSTFGALCALKGSKIWHAFAGHTTVCGVGIDRRTAKFTNSEGLVSYMKYTDNLAKHRECRRCFEA